MKVILINRFTLFLSTAEAPAHDPGVLSVSRYRISKAL